MRFPCPRRKIAVDRDDQHRARDEEDRTAALGDLLRRQIRSIRIVRCCLFGGVPLLAGTGNAQILANANREGLHDLGVAWNGARFAVGGIPEDGMPAALAKERTPISGEVTDEASPLHSTGTASGSRSTWWPSDSCLASSRLA